MSYSTDFSPSSRKSNNYSFESEINTCSKLNDIQKKYLLGLTEEQRRIVIDNSRYVLVQSAAGSGKTRVLIAKYLYLTRVKNVEKEKILYLSFNKKNVEDTHKKMEKLSIDEIECTRFASTFHSLALNIINDAEKVWPKLLENVFEANKSNVVDHDAAEVFIQSHLKLKMLSNKLFKKRLFRDYRIIKNVLPHRYVSYLCDRNDIPGSCRSRTERDIFEFLVKEGIDFAYEEADLVNHCRPDFTIYLKEKEKVIYEHFTKTDDDNYNNEKALKIQEYRKAYGNHFFYTEGGESLESIKSRVLDELSSFKNFHSDNDVIQKDNSTNREENSTNIIIQTVIEKYKEVRNQIIETNQNPDDYIKKYKSQKNFPGFYFTNIFFPIENIYKNYLKGPNVLTDFSSSIIRASDDCSKYKEKLQQKRSYDYVFVDEFQDISLARHNLLKSLRDINPEMHLLAVGDDWQSIYSFSCSDLKLFQNFENNWFYKGKKVARIIPMSITFRFQKPLLDISTSFIANSKEPRLSSHKVRPFVVDKETVINQESFPNDRHKTQWSFIKEIINKKKDKDILVLSRYSNVAKNLQEKINQWIKGGEIKHNPKNTLDCITMHKAKGLDVDIVIIQDCHKDVVPLIKKKRSEHDKLLAMIRGESSSTCAYKEREWEERRLFYVAITRAREEVYLLYNKDRKSLFVDEITKLDK